MKKKHPQSTRKTTLAREYLRRFPKLEIRTLAKLIHNQHPETFKDVENARSVLRKLCGKAGKSRGADPEFLNRETVPLPKSLASPQKSFTLPDGEWGVVSDLHVPVHSDRAVGTALEYLKAKGIKKLLINGDGMDCKATSRHIDMERGPGMLMEVMVMADMLDALRSEFDEVWWKFGNHEGNVQRYFASNAAELLDTPFACLEEVLALETRGITHIPWQAPINAGKLIVIHGDEHRGGGGVMPARWLWLREGTSAMCGHFHKTSMHNFRDGSGELHTCFATGCLCDLTPSYMSRNQWDWGFATLSVEGSDFEVELKRILPDGRVR